MTTRSCERCGYTGGVERMKARCPRCAERAVRAQMRRFAAAQARHLRELRVGGAAADERVGGRAV
jgi:uncharacterized paraquat-inducible protein A